jgi:hypothetical protein
MKRLCAASLIFWSIFFATSVEARDFSGKITDLVTWSDGHSFLTVENGPTNPCGGNYYSLGIKSRDVKAEPMLAMALAAYLSNRRVTISTTNGDCQGGQEKIVNIRILPN